MTSETRTQPNSHKPTGVVVTSGVTANALGVIRCLGRRGISVVYIDSDSSSIARYSKYIDIRLTRKKTANWESDFINLLKEFGMQNQGMLIIPVGDEDVLALAKHKVELGLFYHIPVPEYETVQNLVDKKRFYRILGEMQIPHPKTYFPESLTELVSIGEKVAYPYIIKPAFSIPFQEEFGRKVFHVKSTNDLALAADRLRYKDLEVMIQEIIPGREIYAFFTYFNKLSEPLAICGWDKIRQYPLDFGFGTFCKSNWRPTATDYSLQFLQKIKFHGFAEVEVKKDPRDGQYKMIEINARTSLQNALAGACGEDVVYAAYLDASGQAKEHQFSFSNDILWTDDFRDVVSFLQHLVRRDIGIGELIESLKPQKVRSISAWDDPVPLFVRAAVVSYRAIHSLFTLRKN
jgi:predicted ATP-grasp superfamily ATP-dependent carboligase